MSSLLNLDTLQSRTGGPTTLTGQSAAKAWANLNGTGTIALRDSFNISSSTDNGTGDYTFNFTSALTDVNYQTSHLFDGGSAPSVAFAIAPTATTFRTEGRRTDTLANQDQEYANISIHGDLA